LFFKFRGVLETIHLAGFPFHVRPNVTSPVFEDFLTVLAGDLPPITGDNLIGLKLLTLESCVTMLPHNSGLSHAQLFQLNRGVIESDGNTDARSRSMADRLTLMSCLPSLMGVTAIWFLISNQCFNISAGQKSLRERWNSIAKRYGSHAESYKSGGLSYRGRLIGIPTKVTENRQVFTEYEMTHRNEFIDAGPFCPPRMVGVIGSLETRDQGGQDTLLRGPGKVPDGHRLDQCNRVPVTDVSHRQRAYWQL
jgi:hypothetical protein